METASTMGVKLNIEVKRRLKKLAQIKGRSAHWMMKEAILEYLQREEEQEAERQEDQERWARYLATGKSIPHSKVSSWLKSLGKEKK